MTKSIPYINKWSDEQLTADLEKHYARDWAKSLRKYEKNPKDFHTAWVFLHYHPANQVRTFRGKTGSPNSFFDQNYEIMVVKVDPKTHHIEPKKNPKWRKNKKGKHPFDKKRNTATRVWIEWGPLMSPTDLEIHTPGQDMKNVYPDGCPSHDPRVDTGGKTFEKAIVNLAHNVWMLYRDQPDVSNDAELKKKDRW